jgi:predicted RND superfamily exporter protein
VDNLKVSLLTILFVFIILMFTFKSWGLPIPLTLTIHGAIFIYFSYYYIYGNNLFFFVYLIVSAIQMGATIDYAIVFTNRYVELKTTLSKKEACIEALSGAFPTILTSGTIMAVAGFLIGAVVSDPLISSLGTCLGRGVIISILCVMFVLPSYLIIFDKAIMKTHFKKYGKSKGKIEHLKKRILVKKTNFAKIMATNNITEVEVNNHEEN